MDILSHALIGGALATPPGNSKKDIFIISFFSYLPDLPQIATYLYIGIVNARPYFFPLNSDWVGFRDASPLWSALWEIPHSLFFVGIVILPIVLYFKLPKITLFAYALHIFIDLFTHSGEWAIKIFYPLPYQMSGFADAQAWPLSNMTLSWAMLFVLILISYFVLRTRFFKFKI